MNDIDTDKKIDELTEELDQAKKRIAQLEREKALAMDRLQPASGSKATTPAQTTSRTAKFMGVGHPVARNH